MTWEALAAIAQLAAVVGVVPSLIYLAAQIREQNKERRRGALGVATRGWATIFKTLTDSSEFADIYLRGVQQFDDLSPAERVRLSAFVTRSLATSKSYTTITRTVRSTHRTGAKLNER
jgi:hypothetical protein